MAKRFTSTEIWSEDWFLEMPIEYKLFWYYMLSECDHAGLFKVNLRSFCGLNEVKISSDDALKYFNSGKDRVRVVNKSVWLIEDFFVFQYGTTINLNNRLHESIEKLYTKLDLKLSSIRGVLDLIYGVKDKDKDKVIYKKGKDKKNGTEIRNFKAQGEELFAERISRGLQEPDTP
jgi:hypothetical protein